MDLTIVWVWQQQLLSKWHTSVQLILSSQLLGSLLVCTIAVLHIHHVTVVLACSQLHLK